MVLRSISALVVLAAAIFSGCLGVNPNETQVPPSGPPSLVGHFPASLRDAPALERFDSSLKALEILKGMSGNSYTYTSTNSIWTGYWDSTTITVLGGTVIQRSVVSGRYGSQQSVIRFTETADLGIHHEGARPLTLDSLYRECAYDLKGAPEEGIAFLELDSNSIVSVCGIRLSGCVDYCGPNLHLSNIIWEWDREL
jgi:hypothetical protein